MTAAEDALVAVLTAPSGAPPFGREPSTGRVESASDGLARVSGIIPDGVLRCRYLDSFQPLIDASAAAGRTVLVVWIARQPFVVGAVTPVYVAEPVDDFPPLDL